MADEPDWVPMESTDERFLPAIKANLELRMNFQLSYFSFSKEVISIIVDDVSLVYNAYTTGEDYPDWFKTTWVDKYKAGVEKKSTSQRSLVMAFDSPA